MRRSGGSDCRRRADRHRTGVGGTGGGDAGSCTRARRTPGMDCFARSRGAADRCAGHSRVALSARNAAVTARDAHRDRHARHHRSHFLRPLPRRPADRLRGFRRRRLPPLAAVPGRNHRAAAGRNRGRGLSLLVARQPLGRLLRRWQAEAARHRRRRAANIGNGNGRRGGTWNADGVILFAPDHSKSAVPRVRPREARPWR